MEHYKHNVTEKKGWERLELRGETKVIEAFDEKINRR